MKLAATVTIYRSVMPFEYSIWLGRREPCLSDKNPNNSRSC